jgi:hypothetical protein
MLYVIETDVCCGSFCAKAWPLGQPIRSTSPAYWEAVELTQQYREAEPGSKIDKIATYLGEEAAINKLLARMEMAGVIDNVEKLQYKFLWDKANKDPRLNDNPAFTIMGYPAYLVTLVPSSGMDKLIIGDSE